jgi:AcrR family transcriptional regulator
MANVGTKAGRRVGLRLDDTPSPSAARRRPGRPVGDAGTRERILGAAVEQLSTHGFYGTTVRSVADAVGVTTASLLHHFATKEALYSEVLSRIAASLEGWAASDGTGADPVERVAGVVDGFFEWTRGHDAYSRILLRELMDNVSRARQAQRWHLAEVVHRAVDTVRTARDSLGAAHVDPESFVFQFVGAVVYFFVSLPTAERIFEVDDREALIGRFRNELREATAAALRRTRAGAAAAGPIAANTTRGEPR